MVDVGDRPILQQIMEMYAAAGHRDFVVALGYLGHMIKRHIMYWRALGGDLAIDFASGAVSRNGEPPHDWKVARDLGAALAPPRQPAGSRPRAARGFC
jgi:glucose-1-phosphate cytidylyltransferase